MRFSAVSIVCLGCMVAGPAYAQFASGQIFAPPASAVRPLSPAVPLSSPPAVENKTAQATQAKPKQQSATPKASDATQALISRMRLKPSAARAARIDAFVRSLQDAGIWSKLDVLLVTAAQDEQAALLNWKGGTAKSVANIRFKADAGIAGPGKGATIEAGKLNEFVHAKPTSVSFGIWSMSDSNKADIAMGGITGYEVFTLAPRTEDNMFVARVGDTVDSSVASVSGAGLFVAVRSGQQMKKLYSNGTLAGTFENARAIESLPEGMLTVGGITGSTGSSRAIGLAFVGAALSDSEVKALNDAAVAFFASIKPATASKPEKSSAPEKKQR